LARQKTLTSQVSDLEAKRTVLLRSLSANLSPHIMKNIALAESPSAKTYSPSTRAHTTPCLPTITPEDDAKLMAEAKTVIKEHIHRLHNYNEIRDVGQGLIGMIADQRGVRIVECQEEFGVGVGD
jgi:hypothetical protein